MSISTGRPWRCGNPDKLSPLVTACWPSETGASVFPPLEATDSLLSKERLLLQPPRRQLQILRAQVLLVSMLTPIEAAWLAGFVDGEGSFQIVGKRRSSSAFDYLDAQLVATSTDRPVLDRCAEIASGKVGGPYRAPSNKGKPVFRWTLRGRALGEVTADIQPFLITKAEQAGLILLFRSLVRLGASPTEWGRKPMDEAELIARRDMKWAMNALNHRGSLPVPQERLDALARVRAQIETVARAS